MKKTNKKVKKNLKELKINLLLYFAILVLTGWKCGSNKAQDNIGKWYSSDSEINEKDENSNEDLTDEDSGRDNRDRRSLLYDVTNEYSHTDQDEKKYRSTELNSVKEPVIQKKKSSLAHPSLKTNDDPTPKQAIENLDNNRYPVEQSIDKSKIKVEECNIAKKTIKSKANKKTTPDQKENKKSNTLNNPILDNKKENKVLEDIRKLKKSILTLRSKIKESISQTALDKQDEQNENLITLLSRCSKLIEDVTRLLDRMKLSQKKIAINETTCGQIKLYTQELNSILKDYTKYLKDYTK